MGSTIPPFANHLPVKIRFGEGVAETLPAVVREAGGSSAFVMLDEGIERFNPAAAELIALLDGSGLELT